MCAKLLSFRKNPSIDLHDERLELAPIADRKRQCRIGGFNNSLLFHSVAVARYARRSLKRFDRQIYKRNLTAVFRSPFLFSSSFHDYDYDKDEREKASYVFFSISFTKRMYTHARQT